MKPELTIIPKGDTINIMEGKALDPRHPERLRIIGQIESVNAYLSGRRGTQQLPGALQHIDKDLAVITMDEANMTITLDVDPNHPFGTTVVGKLEFNPDLLAWFINKDKQFTREQLITLLKFNRRFFADPSQHAIMLDAYQKLNLTGQTVLKNESDNRGNKDAAFKKTIDSRTIPTEFSLLMPIFKGQPAKKFRVEVCLDATDASVRFWFESVELIEIIEEDRKTIFNNQVAGYTDFVIIWK
jgi:hypothetical protein